MLAKSNTKTRSPLPAVFSAASAVHPCWLSPAAAWPRCPRSQSPSAPPPPCRCSRRRRRPRACPTSTSSDSPASCRHHVSTPFIAMRSTSQALLAAPAPAVQRLAHTVHVLVLRKNSPSDHQLGLVVEPPRPRGSRHTRHCGQLLDALTVVHVAAGERRRLLRRHAEAADGALKAAVAVISGCSSTFRGWLVSACIRSTCRAFSGIGCGGLDLLLGLSCVSPFPPSVFPARSRQVMGPVSSL
jgi:hypothetical protein